MLIGGGPVPGQHVAIQQIPRGARPHARADLGPRDERQALDLFDAMLQTAAAWDCPLVGGDTTQKHYAGLTPNASHIFVVVAFDEAGAYSPIFSFNANMIHFRVSFAGAQNPRIGILNDFFLYDADDLLPDFGFGNDHKKKK